MNPAEYILPPESVKARFPAELVGTPDFQAIIDACIDRLDLPEPALATPSAQKAQRQAIIEVSNAEGDDLRWGQVTLTVSRRETSTHIENLTTASVLTPDDVRRVMGYRS